jgi:hypothetical protein
MRFCWLLGLALVGCTKPNPAVCCLDAADCNEVGLSEVRQCTPGLACVEHQCEIPSCSMTGCMASTPVCNITTDVCEGCTDSSQCSKFTDTDVCDTATGGCVECVTASDCAAAAPVCDANACRACKLDSECASGACGDDGACVAESAIVYLDPGGADIGTCTRSTPCKTVNFAVSNTSPTRDHVVLGPGLYVGETYFGEASTSATQVFIHGGGATLTHPEGNDGSLFNASMQVTIRDVQLQSPSGTALAVRSTAQSRVERVRILPGSRGMSVGGPLSVKDVLIEDAVAFGILMGVDTMLTMDRVVIKGGGKGITAGGYGPIVQISNLLVYGTKDLALDLAYVNGGMITSSTIANSGTDAGTGPRAVSCSSNVTLRSSIVWAPGTTARFPVEGCNLVSVIAGPTSVPGAANSDPKFVDAAAGDFHIGPSSPARDVVDTGPATDFEGDARPQGARFDIGADEAK